MQKRHRRKGSRSVRRLADYGWARKSWALLIGAAMCAGIAGFLVRPPSGGEGGIPQGSQGPSQQEPSSAVAPSPALIPPIPPDATVDDMVSEATRVGSHLVESFPDSPRAFCTLGQVKFSFGDSAEAVKCWERCLELDPDFAEAYCLMAVAAMRKGENDKAADLLRAAVRLAPDLPEAPNQLAKALMNDGKMDEAIAVLQEAIESDPRSAGCLFLLGQIYLQLADYENAKKNLEAAIKMVPDYSHAYYGLAAAYARLGEKEKAQQCQEMFKSLRAKQVDAEVDQLRHREDRATVRRFLAGAYRNAGRTYYLLGSVREAEAHWLAAAELEPGNPECRLALVQIYQQEGRIREALRMYRQLRGIQPQNLGYCLEIGRLHAELNEFEAAEEAFRNCCELASQSSVGYAALARLYLRTRRKLPEVAALSQKAVDLEPTAQNLFLLSAAHEIAGDTPGAAAALRRAIQLDPHNPLYQQAYESLAQ